MTSTLEQFTLAGLALNDETKLWLEEVSYTPAAKKPQFVGNNDSDGEALVRESHYTNAFLELTIRVVPKSTSDAAREVLGELTNALQQCEREEGGSPIEWTPNNGANAYTNRALLGEYVEVPITVTGDTAGWFIKAPVVKVKLTLGPFWKRPERVVKAATESGAEPVQTLYVGGILGDVPAEARLIVKDTATQDRRFAQWGRDLVSSESNPALLLPASTSLVTEGFSGESKTRSGAYGSEKVIRATALPSPSAMCGTGRISHVGSFAVYLHPYAGSLLSRFRISYRNGDGPLIPLEWKTPTVATSFSDLYMGEVDFDPASLGTQSSEIRIEHRTTSGNVVNDANYLLLIPTGRGSSRARGIANNESTKLLAFDFFEQTEGSLATKSLGLGGTWSGAGDAVDFKVIAASHTANRTEANDANINTGRYALAGSEEPSAVQVSTTVSATAVTEEEKLRVGVLVRYTNMENWVMAVITPVLSEASEWAYLKVIKRVSGTATVLGEVRLKNGVTGITATPIALAVAANGSWRAVTTGVLAGSLEGLDASLGAGGALEKGKSGIYDAWTAAGSNTRTFDSFEAFGTEAAGRVCFSGRKLEMNSAGAFRQDPTGTYDGPPSLYRGGDFYLDPAGESGRINRVAIRMRRSDVEVEEDSNVTDKHSAEVLATERFLIPR